MAFYDSIILKAIEGDEKMLEEKISAFLNSEPRKMLVAMNFSSIGITHYILLIYRIEEGDPREVQVFHDLQDNEVQTYTGKGKGDY